MNTTSIHLGLGRSQLEVFGMNDAEDYRGGLCGEGCGEKVC